MREVIFRGYDLDDKQWHYGSYLKRILRQVAPMGDELKPKDVEHWIIFNGFADWGMEKRLKVANHIDEKSVGQFIGLRDKNHKMIFEGDIVKCHFDCCVKIHERLPRQGDMCFVISYYKGFFGFETFNRELFLAFRPSPSVSVEVIGNVYENPELLEVKNDN